MKLGIGIPGMGQRALTRRGRRCEVRPLAKLALIVARAPPRGAETRMDTGVAPFMHGSRKPLGVVRLLEGSNPSLSAEHSRNPGPSSGFVVFGSTPDDRVVTGGDRLRPVVEA